MEVLIVGGGLYGIVVALRLDRAGHDVTLYEKEPELMRGASGANQWRLHRGYHYPRSEATARECYESAERFRETFPDAVVEGDDHYYCIASERTETTPREFLDHCDRIGLGYDRVELPVVNDEKVDLCLRARESRVDPNALRNACLDRVEESRVRVVRNQRATPADVDEFDATVVTAYAHLNKVIPNYTDLHRRLKFELCEKPLVSLPSQFRGTSAVVMDGPFMCFDPYARSDKFLLGNVIHSVHDRQVGLTPDVPARYEDLLFSGPITDPEITRIDRFLDHGSEYIPGLARADHHGSFYVVRTVLPDVEDTDARPTIVERDGDVFTVLSGKLASCVEAAEEVAVRIENGS